MKAKQHEIEERDARTTYTFCCGTPLEEADCGFLIRHKLFEKSREMRLHSQYGVDWQFVIIAPPDGWRPPR